MIYPFIAVVFDALTLITTKKVFNLFKTLNHRTFAWWIFVWIIIVGLLVSPWLVQINSLALSPHFLWLLLALAFLAANYNLLYYFGLRYEKIAEIEPFFLFNPLVTILIAGLFYTDERFWQIYVAATIAGILLAWSHIKEHHLRLSRPLLAILGFSLLVGLEAVVIKQLLLAYSPVALYLIRAIVTVLFLWIIEKGKIPMISVKQAVYFLAIAVGAVITASLIYFSYQLQGISSTVFVLILSPVLVYILSIIILKERLKWKNIVTSLVIVALVIWVTISG